GVGLVEDGLGQRSHAVCRHHVVGARVAVVVATASACLEAALVKIQLCAGSGVAVLQLNGQQPSAAACQCKHAARIVVHFALDGDVLLKDAQIPLAVRLYVQVPRMGGLAVFLKIDG